ncbi:GNAT family N-acetyltransferase [Allonocardiopsis opalescens]|uniref:RimJ/RimL family protein N-acetyltransferase n=1 Tax=Allonocardiopsis opalescens TaxID=1144618 RepID=A0A2T0QDP5_9ACTN|nr:GNAT family N-acetyltransferase [Allonocardiopsis opalescens]PRY02035.1 RimJ/RimL family protein N-acetyltransferase [Allonocardiopsis opalescens]
MPLWRIRVKVEDRPGRLAGLTRVLAAAKENILGITAQIDSAGVIDEFLVTGPRDPGPLMDALRQAPSAETIAAVPASPAELVDEPTRVLLLASRLKASPQALPEVLRDLLRAEDAAWVDGAASADDLEQDGGGELLVRVGGARHIRLRRPAMPFTLTEAARADAMVRAVLPSAATPSRVHRLRLADGAGLTVRELDAADLSELQRLHDRCSPESRRSRYGGAVDALTPRMFEGFCDPGRGISLVARPEGASEAAAVGHLLYTDRPGTAELALLVRDDWQGRGLGTHLARLLLHIARDHGLAEIHTVTDAGNGPMLTLARRLGAQLTPLPGHATEARFSTTRDHHTARPQPN